MNLFKFPKYVYEIDKINRNFLWNDNKDINIQNTYYTIQTIAYNKICRSKSEGGLEVKKTKNVNEFLAKQS